MVRRQGVGATITIDEERRRGAAAGRSFEEDLDHNKKKEAQKSKRRENYIKSKDQRQKDQEELLLLRKKQAKGVEEERVIRPNGQGHSRWRDEEKENVPPPHTEQHQQVGNHRKSMKFSRAHQSNGAPKNHF